MDHNDHVALIRDGVAGAGPQWLELGAGDGAFTLALADVLGRGGRIVTMDHDAGAIATGADRVRRGYPEVAVQSVQGDFTRALPTGPFDGVLAANSLHFVADRGPVLGRIREALRLGGHLVVVEYDSNSGNPWVPHPFSFESWTRAAIAAGFERPRLIHRVPSRFLGAIYGAVTVPADDLVLHSRPHGEDREE